MQYILILRYLGFRKVWDFCHNISYHYLGYNGLSLTSVNDHSFLITNDLNMPSCQRCINIRLDDIVIATFLNLVISFASSCRRSRAQLMRVNQPYYDQFNSGRLVSHKNRVVHQTGVRWEMTDSWLFTTYGVVNFCNMRSMSKFSALR